MKTPPVSIRRGLPVRKITVDNSRPQDWRLWAAYCCVRHVVYKLLLLRTEGVAHCCLQSQLADALEFILDTKLLALQIG